MVYCLSNPAMPDYLKIGRTSDLDQRLRSLDTTSVPLPFECLFAVEVEDPNGVERLLHQTFEDRRVRSTREFFEVSPQQVVSAMRLTGGRDVTPSEDVVEDEESERALEKAKKRRDAFNFEMAGIVPGTELYFLANSSDEPTETATVFSKNRILFEGAETSLSAAAGELLQRRGMSSNIAGTEYWYIDGETMAERRKRMEQEG